MMNGVRIVAAMYAGFVLYSLLVLFFGPSGIHAYRELSGYRTELEKNIEDLRQVNQDLGRHVSSLRSDREQILLRARELGYFREGDHIIRIAGYDGRSDGYRVGKLLYRLEGENPNDLWFRTLGCTFGLLFFLFSGVFLKQDGTQKV